MVFKKADWQKQAKKSAWSQRISYRDISDRLKIAKSSAWTKLNRKTALITVEEFCLISDMVGINPLDYIVKDGVQLKLL